MSSFMPLTLVSTVDKKVMVNFENINYIEQGINGHIGSFITFLDGSTMHVKEQLNLEWPHNLDKRYVLY